MKVIADIPYRGEWMLDAYLPDTAPKGAIVWYHGGGLESGDRKLPENVPHMITNRGYSFLSVEYRMYPTARFPDYLEDAAAAAAFVLSKGAEWGADKAFFLSGQSAGAYMTMMLCMEPKYLAAAGVSQEQITGFISDSAQQFCHFNVLREMGIDTRMEVINERAPISFIAPGKVIRPLLMIYYTDDMKCRPEENRLMYASFQHVMPEAHVELAELPGHHCCDLYKAMTLGCDFADKLL